VKTRQKTVAVMTVMMAVPKRAPTTRMKPRKAVIITLDKTI
jgi:hypothetical protein